MSYECCRRCTARYTACWASCKAYIERKAAAEAEKTVNAKSSADNYSMEKRMRLKIKLEKEGKKT